MSEFKVHHYVNELLTELGVTTGDSADVYADSLLKNMTGYVTTQVSAHSAKRKIAEYTRKPEEFLRKYDELKSKNVRELDPMVYFLSKMIDDEKTKSVLEQHSKENPAPQPHPLSQISLPQSGSKMSQQEVSELRNQLMSVASSGTMATQPSEAVRKMMREKQAKKNSSLVLPASPSWLSERPFLNADFVITHDNREPTVAIGTLPLPIQEQAVLEDLLSVMTGIEAKYILAQPLTEKFADRTFLVDQSLYISYRELVYRVLPMCGHFSKVARFIEEKVSFEYGMVNHALCNAIRTVLKQYLILVGQLENQHRQGQLTLQKFWFYIQPCMRTMEILGYIADSIDKGACTGGAVLSLLHNQTSAVIGDAKAQDLCLFLTQSACAPYFEMLEKWIYKGIIQDPYCEFLIEEDESVQKEMIQKEYNDAYWERRYTICRDRIPVFLEQCVDKILNTGKYLNVVRQCGRDPKCPSAEEILYTLKDRQYVEVIEKAHSYSSKMLVDLLMEERELLGRLRSIKHYFLMEQGDFFVHFMDIAEDELKKDVENIIRSRLETLLELAQRTSQANNDPFKDDLKVELSPYDLITQLLRILAIDSQQEKSLKLQDMDPTEMKISGLEAFSFDYVVRWPESLILSRKALTRYQMLFRHLFYAKHVERLLCNVWVGNKMSKQYSVHTAQWYASAFALRQRMIHFVQNFEYYMMFEVIEPNWLLLEANLKSISNIDDVIAHHADFLDKCLKDCMLTNTELLKIVSKLLLVCVTFHNFVQRVTESMNVEEVNRQTGRNKRKETHDADDRQTTSKVVSDHVDQVLMSENFERTVETFDSNFSKHLIDLLDKLSVYSHTECEHNMMNIIYRLNFNGFYTQPLEKLAAERSMLEMQHIESYDPGYGVSSGSSSLSSSDRSTKSSDKSPGSKRSPPSSYLPDRSSSRERFDRKERGASKDRSGKDRHTSRDRSGKSRSSRSSHT
ncbi:gamma-tubulin complex component 2-like [Glandiceps talaboti]